MSLKYNSKLDFISKIVDHYEQLKYALLEAQTFDPDSYGFPEAYYKVMEMDSKRINAFHKAFRKHHYFKDKIVCEVGAGTLALSRLFLDQVKKAYLIESNPKLIPLIKTELKKYGWDKKVILIEGDALKVRLPEKVDFIFGELMSIFCANELQVQVFRHMRQFLKPKGKLLPEKIINLAQLCRAEFEENHRHYPLFFTHHLPEQYTPQKVVNTIDLYKVSKLEICQQTTFKPTLSGIVNAVYLHSWIQISEGANFTGTDSLMPPTVLKLKKPEQVKAGNNIRLHASFRYGTSLDLADFWLEQ